MARYRLALEYAGTRYRGWQVQRNARTVQGTLLEALAAVTGEAQPELYGSGRTDAGVHALLQVAHLELGERWPPERLRRDLNDALPADIHVLALAAVPPGFHARHGATGRSYLYQVSRRRSAFAKPFVWWVRNDLDTARMRSAASHLVGMRDFRSFTDADPDAGSTRVLVESVEIGEDGDLVLVRIRGSHFLWKMVRRIVGVLVEVGRGGLPADATAGFLAAASAEPARLTAPASGLFLEQVIYQGERFDRPLRSAVPVVTGFAASMPESGIPLTRPRSARRSAAPRGRPRARRP